MVSINKRFSGRAGSTERPQYIGTQAWLALAESATCGPGLMRAFRQRHILL